MSKARYVVGDDKRELPYEFDLLWDVKSYAQVERIAKYLGDCSDATPEDLIELFQLHEMKVPECLSTCTPIIYVWILPNGTWLSYAPLAHEEPEARRVRIQGWKK